MGYFTDLRVRLDFYRDGAGWNFFRRDADGNADFEEFQDNPWALSGYLGEAISAGLHLEGELATALSRLAKAEKEQKARAAARSKELTASQEETSTLHERLLVAEKKAEELQSEAEQVEKRVAELTQERDEARQLARDIWQSLPTASKLEVFERGDGWVPGWVRQAPRQSS